MSNNVKPLDFMEEQLLLEYVECGNLTEAGRRVGFEKGKARAVSERKVFKEEYERITGTALGRAEVTAERLVQELANIAFLDPYDVIDDNGHMRPLRDMPAHVRRAIGGLKITTKDGERFFQVTTEPKILDKMKAIELLGKWSQIKMFVDRVETDATDNEARDKNMELEERLALMEKDRASVVKED